MSKPKMLVIDGSSMLATCYYAALPNEIKFAKTDEEKEQNYYKILKAPDGTYTNAIMGMCRMIANIVEEGDFDNIITVFDKSRKTTFRRAMYPQYKAQRSETPAPLKNQMVLIQQILSESGFPVLLNDEYEADDLAGSVTEKYKSLYDVSLLTKDRDYLQLVDDTNNVKCLIMTDYDKAEEFRKKYNKPAPEERFMQSIMEFDDAAVFGEKGVYPRQIPDLKGLEGDASDNIPGVKGVSAATAAPLLRAYGSITHIYAELEQMKTDSVALKQTSEDWRTRFGFKRSPLNALIAGEEFAFLSAKLATIVCDIPLPPLNEYTVDRLNTVVFDAWMEKLAIRNITLKPRGLQVVEDGEWVFYASDNRKDVEFYYDPDEDTDVCDIPLDFLTGITPVESTKDTYQEVTQECEASVAQVESPYKEDLRSNEPATADVISEADPEDVDDETEAESYEQKLNSMIFLMQETNELSTLNNSFESASALLVKLFDQHYHRIKQNKEEKNGKNN